jgi:hypothetical protein
VAEIVLFYKNLAKESESMYEMKRAKQCRATLRIEISQQKKKHIETEKKNCS